MPRRQAYYTLPTLLAGDLIYSVSGLAPRAFGYALSHHGDTTVNFNIYIHGSHITRLDPWLEIRFLNSL